MPRTSPLALAFLALTITACEDSAHRCGPFVYSPEEGRCTCPPGWIENEEFTGCLSLDAGPPPDDAAMPDAGTCVPEECNGEDDDCDGATDEDAGDTTYYRDADGDGRGDPENTITACPSANPTGYSERADDCDDRHPYAGNETCNGVDDDCDGAIDDEEACATTCSEVTNDGRVYSFCTPVGPWAGAAVACAGRRSSLVSVGSEMEHTFVSGHLASLGVAFGNGEPIFIGGADLDENDVWTWTVGGDFWSGDQMGSPVGGAFYAWDGDHPSGGGRCASYESGRWTATDCDWPRHFICERRE